MAEASDTLVTVTSNSSLEVNSDSPVEATEEAKNEKAYFPILVAESTLEAVPPNLQAIIESLSESGGSSVNKFDLLVCIFYVLMLESGFVPNGDGSGGLGAGVDFHKQRLLSFRRMPACWKSSSDNSYYLEFVLQPFPRRVCRMVCSSISSSMNVNVMVEALCDLCSHFRASKYVTNPESEFVPLKYRHLDELAVEFKNKVSTVAKQCILREEDVTHASLQSLPCEVLYNIFVRLPVKDFVHLINTCQHLKQCSAYFEQKLWKHFYQRDFPGAQSSNELTWRANYMHEYRRKPYRKPIQHHYFYDLMDII